MSFRAKLLLAFTLTVVVSVGAVAWAVWERATSAFVAADAQRTAALVEQFRHEFARRGEEIGHRIAGIAEAEATYRMALDLYSRRATPNYGDYVNDALGLASAHQLDFLELVGDDGTIISLAHWPARFGYRNEWVLGGEDWAARGPFLKREELPDGPALALLAVRAVRVGDKSLYVIGGRRLDREFLSSLVLPSSEMRVLLYANLADDFSTAALTGPDGPVERGDKLQPLIESVRQRPAERVETIAWSADPASAETFHAIPLTGRNADLLGVLLVGSSRRALVELQSLIRNVALLVAAGGVLLGFLLSWWAAARVTRPVERLAAGARQVAAGDWTARVSVRSRDELGQLAAAFNEMTEQLLRQRDRLVQAERVAAWREVARRLAHELKNPLFPLQVTVENLRRAREHNSDQFDEVFRESAETLLAEIENLKTIIGRFSDFAKMPQPELRPTDLNEVVRGVLHLFEPQFSAVGRPQVTPELYLDDRLPAIQADPVLLRRAMENLVLNALDAMPAGGTLIVRTAPAEAGVRLEISDTGTGLTREECERLFTPYYTTRQHGTGLGLAIVQAVVSDHSGKVAVESEPGRGTTFRIELPLQPLRPASRAPAPRAAAPPPRPAPPRPASPAPVVAPDATPPAAPTPEAAAAEPPQTATGEPETEPEPARPRVRTGSVLGI